MTPAGRKRGSNKATVVVLFVVLFAIFGGIGYGYYWLTQPAATYSPQMALQACNAAKTPGCQDTLNAGRLCQNGSVLVSVAVLNDDQLLACGSAKAMREQRSRGLYL